MISPHGPDGRTDDTTLLDEVAQFLALSIRRHRARAEARIPNIEADIGAGSTGLPPRTERVCADQNRSREPQ